MGRRPNSGFGRAIQVPHRALLGQHALGQVGRQRFATAQALDPVQQGTAFAVQEHAPARRRGLHHTDRFALHQTQNRLGVQGHFLVGQHHRRSRRQWHVEFQGKDIERERGQRQQPRVSANGQGAGHAMGEAAQCAMTHHHALGLAGGTGGVDHIGQVLARQCHLGVGAAVACVLLRVHEQHLLVGRQGQALVQVAGSQ
ncbi:hypothetical protein FX984_06375 [Pseudomonas marginalis]|nr:hypothetical protein FX984_06375 [Pseudomonas marginalis]